GTFDGLSATLSGFGASAFSTLGSASIASASAFSASRTRSTSTCSVAGASGSSTLFFSSDMDQLSGLGRDADLLAVTQFEADSGRLAVGGRDRDLRHVQRRLGPLDPALRIGLRRLAVTRMDVDPRHDHLAFLRHRLDDVAGAALVLAAEDDDAVALLDLLRGHHSTSGASEMIFMCFFARSSRTTGPKIRVPIGSSFLLTSTAALLSKRITDPSGRRMSLAVRTITAR